MCQWHRRRLILHACILEHIRPLAASTGMAVFQVLAEVVSTEELLALITFAEFMGEIEVINTLIPVGRVVEFQSAVATSICRCGVEETRELVVRVEPASGVVWIVGHASTCTKGCCHVVRGCGMECSFERGKCRA